jgi:hypothetical protein
MSIKDDIENFKSIYDILDDYKEVQSVRTGRLIGDNIVMMTEAEKQAYDKRNENQVNENTTKGKKMNKKKFKMSIPFVNKLLTIVSLVGIFCWFNPLSGIGAIICIVSLLSWIGTWFSGCEEGKEYSPTNIKKLSQSRVYTVFVSIGIGLVIIGSILQPIYFGPIQEKEKAIQEEQKRHSYIEGIAQEKQEYLTNKNKYRYTDESYYYKDAPIRHILNYYLQGIDNNYVSTVWRVSYADVDTVMNNQQIEWLINRFRENKASICLYMYTNIKGRKLYTTKYNYAE